jgi:EpsD family peptidyl-prolyl cis-trans isomerase
MAMSTRKILLAGLICVALAGCGKKAPTGQVVATVNGKEITTIELNNELNGFQAPNAQVRKAAEQQALNNIVTRKVLAQAAEKNGIAKTTAFAQQEQKLRETLLVQSWQAQISKMVPAPSHEEVDKYIADHPDMFGQRKIFELDQVRFARGIDPNVAKQFGPIKTLPAMAALLAQNNVRFEQGKTEVDALALDPTVLAQIMKLPPGEVFILPAGNLLIANQIIETKVQPVNPDIASKRAEALIKAQRTREALQRQFGGVLNAAKKNVVYNKAYQPAPPKPPAAAGAQAAPAAQPPANPVPKAN